MSTDGQESRGDMPTEPGRCECGDLEPLHVIRTNGERGACSNSMCGCRRYVAVQGSAATKRLYHFTCEHSAKSIVGEDELHGNEHPLLPGVGPIIWLTDMEVPDALALGLTSNIIRCDRTAYRFAVQTDRAEHWPVAARRLHLGDVRRGLEFAPGARPMHWWIVTGADPLPILTEAVA